MRLRKPAPAAFVALSLLLALPGAASAATAKLTSSTDSRGSTSFNLEYTAAAGEQNQVRFTYPATTGAPSAVVVRDPAGVTPAEGCSRPVPTDSTTASCAVPGNVVVSARVQLGDRDDDVAFSGAFDVDLLGGDGNDVLNGTDFGSSLSGGPGDDRLVGGSGDDRFEVDQSSSSAGNDVMVGGPGDDTFDMGSGADGSDTMLGGGGEDEVHYDARRHRVRADLRGDRDDGEHGERDRIASDVEDLFGGRGRDRLGGNNHSNYILGGLGSDRISGAGGNDTLLATDGGDHGRDVLSGGSGRDHLVGSAGNNRFDGGRGRDSIEAGRGNDLLRLRDGSRDRASCGSGFDRVFADRFDRLGRRCELVRRRR